MRLMILSIVLLTCAQDAEKRDNPEYKGWAGFRPGSWVEYRDEIVGEPHPPDHRTTFKLAEVTAEKVVIDLTVKLRRNAEQSESTSKYEIPSRVKATDLEPGEKGEEELELGGKRVKCSWEKWKTVTQGKKGIRKIWLQPEVPGQLVKEEHQIEGQFGYLRLAIRWEKK